LAEVFFKNIIKYYSIEVLHFRLIEVIWPLFRVPRLWLKVLKFMENIGGEGSRHQPFMLLGVVGESSLMIVHAFLQLHLLQVLEVNLFKILVVAQVDVVSWPWLLRAPEQVLFAIVVQRIHEIYGLHLIGLHSALFLVYMLFVYLLEELFRAFIN
jgi:hypothetical protein